MTMPVKRKSFLILAASVAVLLASSSPRAQAQSATWLGTDTAGTGAPNGTPSMWSDPANWSNGSGFPGANGGTTDVATFDANAQSFTPTISGTDPQPAITLGGLTINTSTSPFTFTVDG